MRDSFLQGISQLAVTSRPSFDSMSVEHNSRHSLLVLPLPVMMVQEERGPMMVATLEMMKGMLDNNNKVDDH